MPPTATPWQSYLAFKNATKTEAHFEKIKHAHVKTEAGTDRSVAQKTMLTSQQLLNKVLLAVFLHRQKYQRRMKNIPN